ncbi:MAG: hypothetical protein COA80_12560 [Leeuwenhoekiella sp.]|nr:MAG: hypothetical protein COA80_12560 [Leeuwenhoekiella sp.]
MEAFFYAFYFPLPYWELSVGGFPRSFGASLPTKAFRNGSFFMRYVCLALLGIRGRWVPPKLRGLIAHEGFQKWKPFFMLFILRCYIGS